MKRNKKRIAPKDKQPVVRKKQNKNSATNSLLLVSGSVAAFILFFVFKYFSPAKTALISNDLPEWIFLFFSFVLAVDAFIIIGFYKEERSKKLASISFLILILLNIIRSLIPTIDLTISQTNNILKFELIRSFFYVPTFVFGIISIWLYREKINELINLDVKNSEKKPIPEEIKNNFFSKILYMIKQEGVIYIIGLIIVTGVSGTILLYQLDHFDFWSDEKQVTQAAAGYYHTGEFQQWNFNKEKPYPNAKFDRSYPHLWLVAQSYKIFGISEWSSRLVSALCGVLFIFIGYFILKYFFRNKLIVLFILIVLAMHPEEILLFRWTRMYALLAPFFLLQFFIVYAGITESGGVKGKNKLASWINKNLDYKYAFIIAFFLLAFLGYYIHKSSVFVLPSVFVFIIYLAFKERKAKYYYAILISLLIIIFAIIFIPSYIPTHVMTFFGRSNFIYIDLFNFYPFNKELNIIFLLVGLPMLFFVKDKKTTNVLVYFYIMTIVSLIMFVFVISYVKSFRYISFIVPISIALTIYLYLITARAFYHKYITKVLYALLIISGAMHLYNRWDDLYVLNFASKSKPSMAYKEIVKNYKKGEAVFYQYPIHYYFKGIDTSAVLISMSHSKLFKFENYKSRKNIPQTGFYEYLKEYKSGWVVWDTQNSWHIDSTIYSYVNYNFKKIHGQGIDDTYTEVYRYSRDMVISPDSFNNVAAIPTGNLKMSNAYSFSCWLKMGMQTNDVPYFFIGDSLSKIIKFEETEKGLRVRYADNGANDHIETNNIKDGNWHHVVYYQQSGKKGDEYGLYIDGRKISSNKIPFNRDEFVKFKANIRFRGGFDEMRIYDFVLSQNQINAIYNNGTITGLSKLVADDRYFETIYFWTKRY